MATDELYALGNERDRYRKALEKIANPTFNENPLVFTLEMIELARDALNPTQDSLSGVTE